jgi:RNA polymerase sigma-70 factor (ECF subfamily)
MVGGNPSLFAAVTNGVPALVMTSGDRVVIVVSFEVTTDGITAVHTQANPAKLDHATRQWATIGRGEPLPADW